MPTKRRDTTWWTSVLACLAGWLLLAAPAHAAEQVPVPDVRGLPEAQARAAIARAGLTVAGVETVDASQLGRGYTPGSVYQQAPPPSSQALPSWLPRGGRVYLRVVAGSPAMPVTPSMPTARPPVAQPPVPQPPVARPPVAQPPVAQPPVPQPSGPTPRTWPGGMRPPPPPAPPGMGPVPSVPYVAPGPTTIPMPVQPAPGQPLPAMPQGQDPRDIAGFVEVPSEPSEPPGAAGLRTQITQYSLPCERLRDTWTLQGRLGWAFTAGSDDGDSAWYAGIDFTRWWDGCFGLGLYYRFSAQTFDTVVPGGLLEDAGGMHHLGIKLNYQSTFARGGRWYWWTGLGFGWFNSTGYQSNQSAFEGYGEAGVGYLLGYRMRLRAGVDVIATDTRVGRYDPSRDGSSRLLWWFAPALTFEYDL